MKRTSKLFNLNDRVIVVAGGAGQIGFSFCEILADAGATIVLADIDVEMALEKLKKITPELSKNMIPVKLDVSDPKAITQFYQEIATKFGGIYGLVNCFHFKGNTRKLDTSASFFSGIETYPLEAWNLVHDINLRGTFLMIQGAIPLFKTNGKGVIVNISSTYGNVSANKSIYGDSGINSPVAYATSKAAIINLTRYTATHLAELNIRANTLSPGGVYNNQSSEFVTNYTNLTPLKRMANADDYQGAILFMMSDASEYMTGANINVDGGWTAW